MKTPVIVASCLALSLAYSTNIYAGTVGTLSWDGSSDYIIDSASDTTYLQLGLLAGFSWQQQINATMVGGAYENYHIANQTEAYAFYNAMAFNDVSDIPGDQFIYEASLFSAGALGDSYTNRDDIAVFLSNGDGGFDLGVLALETQRHQRITINDGVLELAFYIDNYATDPRFPFAALMVSDTLIATPIPAAAFMFAPALLGFLGFRRKLRS